MNTDLQEIIAQSTIRAFNAGVKSEQDRIITLLQTISRQFKRKEELERAIAKLKQQLESTTNFYHSDRQVTRATQDLEGQS